MRRSVPFLGFALLCSLACALGHTPCEPAPAQPAGGAKDKKKEEKDKYGCSTAVCPLYLWGYWGGAYHYYAERCSTGEFVALASGTPLGTPTSCQVQDCPGCVNVGMYLDQLKARKKYGDPDHLYHQFFDPKIAEGVPPGADPSTVLLSKDATAVLPPFYIDLGLNAANDRTARVLLCTVVFTPPAADNRPKRVFGAGVEVTRQNGQNPTLVKYQNTSRWNDKNKVCVVQIGNVSYQVVLIK